MPPAAKKRKISSSAKGPLTAPAAQRSIQAFGKISKSQAPGLGKSISGKNGVDKESKSTCGSGNVKKRKLDSTFEDKEEEEATSSLDRQASFIVDSSWECSIQPTASASTQTKAVRENVPFPRNDVVTPTKGARSHLESFALASSSPSNLSSSSRTTGRETPPSSPVSVESHSCQHHESHQLPDELQDLVNLHSSFLTALSLHHAHNGSMTPADLRNLRPGIERVWRKRKVSLDDVRRILAVGRTEQAKEFETGGPLYLSDYGHGKICVEIADYSDLTKIKRRPICEEALKTAFSHDLHRRWTCYRTENPADPSPSNFLESITLLPITPCTSLSKIAPLLFKGQRRLEDLKAGAIKAQQKPLSVTSGNAAVFPPPSKPKPIAARSADLFSRLKAKQQLRQSTLPLPPSPESLARKSAICRIREIIPVLESLASSSSSKKTSSIDDTDTDAIDGGSKSVSSPVSFTMPTLIQHLQMSLRNPIAKDEAVRSLRILAEELAPESIKVKEMGKIVTVTIRGAGLRKIVSERRIESLSGENV